MKPPYFKHSIICILLHWLVFVPVSWLIGGHSPVPLLILMLPSMTLLKLLNKLFVLRPLNASSYVFGGEFLMCMFVVINTAIFWFIGYFYWKFTKRNSIRKKSGYQRFVIVLCSWPLIPVATFMFALSLPVNDLAEVLAIFLIFFPGYCIWNGVGVALSVAANFMGRNRLAKVALFINLLGAALSGYYRWYLLYSGKADFHL